MRKKKRKLFVPIIIYYAAIMQLSRPLLSPAQKTKEI